MENSETGRFEILPHKDGSYHFRLYARNGMLLMKSQKYASLAGCLNAIESVRFHAERAVIVDKTGK